ncbi:glycerol kinase, partial [Streptomyces sp. Ncost-T6T-2b]
MADFIGAVDQGTTSTRFMIFDHGGNEVAKHQLEHEQILPRSGWVEHDPVEIWERTNSVIQNALRHGGLSPTDLVSIGITNQRETTVVWDPRNGRPYYNAIVWQDTRTDVIAANLERSGKGEVIRRKAGLPPATYFSGGKIQWILENVDGVREAAEAGHAIFGNTDAWVLWNLTGGPNGGIHATDVTNASRTMLMNLETLDWDEELLGFFGIPRSTASEDQPLLAPGGLRLHAHLPAAERRHPHRRRTRRPAGGHRRPGLLLPRRGQDTYGTGNFLVLNTGAELV